MERITNTDLEMQLNRYIGLLDMLGMRDDTVTYGIEHGSKLYGRAFRLYVTGGEHGSGHGQPPVGSDYLGMTKREAFDTLATINRTMSDIIYAQRSK